MNKARNFQIFSTPLVSKSRQNAIYSHIVTVANILCQTKRWFAFSKICLCAGTKVFEEALNAVKFFGWLKKFGSAQNISEPVKGQGINWF